jgi:hypothetical protein
MATAAFSTLCVGRHATAARTKSLATSQWSSSLSGGSWHPQTANIPRIAISSSASDFSLSADSALLQKVIPRERGGESWDFASLSSAAALAAFSMALMAAAPSSTSAEPSQPTKPTKPVPMATSNFATPSSPFSSPLSDSSAPRRVQIVRNNLRRRISLEKTMVATEAALPGRFRFYNTGCEAQLAEDQKKDILRKSRSYEVSCCLHIQKSVLCSRASNSRQVPYLMLPRIFAFSFRSLLKPTEVGVRRWKMRL